MGFSRLMHVHVTGDDQAYAASNQVFIQLLKLRKGSAILSAVADRTIRFGVESDPILLGVKSRVMSFFL